MTKVVSMEIDNREKTSICLISKPGVNWLKYDFLLLVRKVALLGSLFSFFFFFLRTYYHQESIPLPDFVVGGGSARSRNGYSRDKSTKSLSRWPGPPTDRSGT